MTAANPLKTNRDSQNVVGLWVSSPSQNAINGQTKDGKKTVTTIDAAANGCDTPSGLKVDRKQNLWVACLDSDTIQRYAPGSNTPAATYHDYYCSARCHQSNNGASSRSGARPAKEDPCEIEGFPADLAFDSQGHVFAANPLSLNVCPTYTAFAVAALVWWSARNPHQKMAVITWGIAASVDVDDAGKLYVGYSDGCYEGSIPCENAVGEVANPTSASAAFTTIIAPAPSVVLGGVYVSNNGTVLNVVNETARTVSQYALPWVAGETPFNVLGPTLERMGKGAPVTGGFDTGDKHIAIGDADGWVDIGDVSSNRWSAAGDNSLSYGNAGAAYVPSDK